MKKVICFTFILIAIVSLMLPVFADQYGETYYQVVQDYPSGGPRPLPVSEGENEYTFCLFFHILHNQEIPLFQGTTTNFTQILEDGTATTITLTINTNYEVTISGTWGTQTFGTSQTGTLVIPFRVMAGNSLLNYNFCEVLNNEQLTGSNEADGYTLGYNQGAHDAEEALEAGKELISAVVSTPINYFMNMLSFEILGINIASLIIGIMSLALVIAIVKKVIK